MCPSEEVRFEGSQVVPADFARELERENAKLLAANAELITVGAELSATADELRAENAELRKDRALTLSDCVIDRQAEVIAELRADKARLDWLEENMTGSFGPAACSEDLHPIHSWTFDAPVHDSVRAAIDAAMEGEK
jgi:hypothetical protein